MMLVILYALIAVAVATVTERVLFRNLTDYNKKNNREFSVVPALGVGAFWPFAGPSFLVFLGVKKLLDKYLKV
ncbi:membrane protein [Pseudomonas phage UFV-P2]|uniref:Uncharacterized protein n=1 Tax=Pseudomonas phage UFV-P2 TaxID=1235661 RepID=M4T2Z3_9CAUD|nr:membrane protein [Pseudomonas phage UFV-P2]AGH62722.1 hypothetical protein [Pseudomonas phage UFV-P2]